MPRIGVQPRHFGPLMRMSTYTQPTVGDSRSSVCWVGYEWTDDAVLNVMLMASYINLHKTMREEEGPFARLFVHSNLRSARGNVKYNSLVLEGRDFRITDYADGLGRHLDLTAGKSVGSERRVIGVEC